MAWAAMLTTFCGGSTGTIAASRPRTTTGGSSPSMSSTVTVSPIWSTASPRMSKPGPTLPMEPGAKTFVLIGAPRVWRSAH